MLCVCVSVCRLVCWSVCVPVLTYMWYVCASKCLGVSECLPACLVDLAQNEQSMSYLSVIPHNLFNILASCDPNLLPTSEYEPLSLLQKMITFIDCVK